MRLIKSINLRPKMRVDSEYNETTTKYVECELVFNWQMCFCLRVLTALIYNLDWRIPSRNEICVLWTNVKCAPILFEIHTVVWRTAQRISERRQRQQRRREGRHEKYIYI